MPEQRSAFDYVSEIWNIAEYVRDVIRPADYNKLVLPFALLRRLECALEPTRDAVCKAVETYEPTLGRENEIYCTFSGKSFYNVTSFRLNDLGIDRTLDALMEYIDGFSPNARDILTKFKIRETCQDLQNEGMLHEVCMRFAGFDLSPEAVPDRMMSDIYEHLIQRYGEEIAQGAEDFMTPRDVVDLPSASSSPTRTNSSIPTTAACEACTTAHAEPAGSSATRSTCWRNGRPGRTRRPRPRSSPTVRKGRA